jgi:hypothetical protein
MKVVLIINLAATLVMVGVIWAMQIVHYPLFNMVGREQFVAYEWAHIQRVSLLVMPIMLVEAGTALLLALQPPAPQHSGWYWLLLGLLAVIWASTLFLQDSQHGTLARGFEATAHESLVLTNWIRTGLWSGRGVILSLLTLNLLR